MSNRSMYEVVAFPKGERRVVATLWGLDENGEAMVQIAAMTAGVPAGTEAQGMVNAAQKIAERRGEFVDLMRDGQHIATVGPEGVA